MNKFYFFYGDIVIHTKRYLTFPLFLTLFFLVTVFYSNFSHAGGPVHGAKAMGMGSAFVAVSDDPSAILHNPAGLTQLQGTQVYGGATLVIPSSEFESAVGTEKTETQVFFPPHIYGVTDTLGHDVMLGLGIYSPFGIGGRKWSDTGLTRYLSTEGYIATVAVNPTIAWKPTSVFSLAFGIDYMFAQNKAERKLNQSSFGASDAKMEIDTDGDGWGYNLGILFHPSDTIHIGLAFRSAIDIDFDGDLSLDGIAPPLQSAFGGNSFRTDVATGSEFPEIYSFGIAIDPQEHVTIAFDLEYGRWSSFDDSTLDLAQEIPAAGMTDATVTLDWEDAWQVKIGAEFRFLSGYQFRAGYAYVQSPVPDNTLEAGNPDADQHNFAIGLGKTFGQWQIDGFYNLALYEDRFVSNRFQSGEYSNISHYLGFSAGYLF